MVHGLSLYMVNWIDAGRVPFQVVFFFSRFPLSATLPLHSCGRGSESCRGDGLSAASLLSWQLPSLVAAYHVRSLVWNTVYFSCLCTYLYMAKNLIRRFLVVQKDLQVQ